MLFIHTLLSIDRGLMKFFADYTNLLLLATACISALLLAWPALTRRSHGLSVQEATQLINRRHAAVIDLRSVDEYRQGHLPQARHINFEAMQSKPEQVNKNKRVPILLICQRGKRASKAQAILAQAGYAEVFTLQGGLDAWQHANMPVIK